MAARRDDEDAQGESIDLDDEDEAILSAVWRQIAAETRANPDKYAAHDARVERWAAQKAADKERT